MPSSTADPNLRALGSNAGQPAADVARAVLIVEDEPDIARMLKSLFVKAGMRVVAALSIAEGIALVEGNPSGFGLAFVDCHAEGLGNSDFCQRVRAVHPGLPLVMAGGHVLAASAAGSAGGGVTLFVSRPYLPTELVWTVRTMLHRTAA
ncbi:MAG: response regulator receiver protein [Verrucomicrobia bacterium]|nr:response regulator receiver protein [Verrucomicrobiota bacterium]